VLSRHSAHKSSSAIVPFDILHGMQLQYIAIRVPQPEHVFGPLMGQYRGTEIFCGGTDLFPVKWLNLDTEMSDCRTLTIFIGILLQLQAGSGRGKLKINLPSRGILLRGAIEDFIIRLRTRQIRYSQQDAVDAPGSNKPLMPGRQFI